MANKKQSGFGKWASSRKGQQVIICAAFAIIPLLLLLVFTYIPFGEMVKFSFYKMKYTTPVEKREFVGLENYIDVFTRKDCFGALKLSLYYIVGALVQLVLALFLATLLSFKVKGGNLFKGFIFFPYLISGIAVGFIFKFFFTRGFVFDSILQLCGFSLDNLPYWLKDQSVNNWTLVSTSVWRYLGQMMVLFIGAIMSVDAELYEAAELDGANKFQQFKYHTAKYQDNRYIKCNFSNNRITQCFRAAFRYHNRCKRNRYLLHHHEQDSTYKPEGRSCFSNGRCTSPYHTYMCCASEAVL